MKLLIRLPEPLTRWLQAPGTLLARGFELARPLRRLLARVADTVPPTWRGAAVAALGALALWRWGYQEMDLLIFVFGLAALVLLATATTIVACAAVYLHRRLEHGGEGRLDLETLAPTATPFKLPALSKLPLLEIEWTWDDPAIARCRGRLADHFLTEEVVAERRALGTALVREITLRDAFGLTRIAWRRRDPRPLRVLPSIGRLRSMPRVVSMSSAEGLPHPSGAPEGDRMEIRRYVPGDSARHILWKTYARTRQLNVRVPERAIDRTERTVAYLLSSADDEAAAAAARVAIENNLLGERWLFAADGSPEPTDDRELALDAVARSGGDLDLPNDGPLAGLRAFLDHPDVRREQHCVVFAAARPGPWADEALRLGAERGGALSFVLGTDGVRQDGPRPLWRRLLFQDRPDAAAHARELRTMLTTFERSRLNAMVVDRKTGRVHGRREPLPATWLP
ncbi:MAG: DUF58 domain-containing protein, partial [Acidobacteriota bacterium]